MRLPRFKVRRSVRLFAVLFAIVIVLKLIGEIWPQ
jgi:hypothetical protein